MWSTVYGRTEKPRPYHYFDTPDGQDLDKKMYTTIRYASFAGAGLAAIDILLKSKPVGYVNTIGRFAFMALPVVGISASFVFAVNTLASVREKDDCYNWTFGGAVAGGLFGVWTKNQRVGWNCALLIGIAATLRKLAHENGHILIPKNKPRIHSSATSGRYDYSLAKDEPGAWRKKWE